MIEVELGIELNAKQHDIISALYPNVLDEKNGPLSGGITAKFCLPQHFKSVSFTIAMYVPF